MTIKDQLRAEETLSAALVAHVGEWVAVRDAKVVAFAPTLEALTLQIGDQAPAMTAFQVGDDADVACFY